MNRPEPNQKPAEPAIRYDRKKLSRKQLLSFYRYLLLPRLVEEKMLILLRQGRISKWFSGIGQEAIAVGATLALEPDEVILPMHRNLGVFTTRGVPLEKLFLQFQGKPGGFTKGRDRSFHFGAPEYFIHGMISHLGPQLSVADGYALARLLKKEPKATLVFTGEGGTSEGEFHEAMNVASVWNLPVIFLVENNGYGLSTPVKEQFTVEKLAIRGQGYNMDSATIDGNNILEVYHTVSRIAGKMRKKPAPFLLECMTFRMRGHEEASGTKYVPKELMKFWARKDPVANYEQYLIREKILTEDEATAVRKELKSQINEAWEKAYQAPPVQPRPEKELRDVYARHPKAPVPPPGDAGKKMRFVDALSEALDEAMARHENLVLMGQDIAEYGGVFKVTQGLLEKYGRERVRNTPLCESAIIGTALGLSAMGFKSMVEMQFADFVACGFNQIVNNLAKIHYRWGLRADVVIRMPCGGGVSAGPFHSQSNEAWFVHTPGLKVVYPATPEDAKGLLLASFEDPNPVLFFEHKALYRSIHGEVPEGYYTLPVGKARTDRSGEDVSVITYGAGLHWARKVLDRHPDISADLIDLRTLLPLDRESIRESVRKTGKAIILHEDTLTGGIGAEIAAFIAGECFEWLDAPVVRSAALDTPVPFTKELEDQFMPASRFEKQLLDLLNF